MAVVFDGKGGGALIQIPDWVPRVELKAGQRYHHKRELRCKFGSDSLSPAQHSCRTLQTEWEWQWKTDVRNRTKKKGGRSTHTHTPTRGSLIGFANSTGVLNGFSQPEWEWKWRIDGARCPLMTWGGRTIRSGRLATCQRTERQQKARTKPRGTGLITESINPNRRR